MGFGKFDKLEMEGERFFGGSICEKEKEWKQDERGKEGDLGS